jgi:predicted dithiol-disulfide oxidoreductase (DUF899 family)
MSHPEVVSRERWLSAREQLLASEMELTRLHDAVNADRRRLPMVRMEKEYLFDGPDGPLGLPELFDGRTQLIIQHFMFDPAWATGCPSCAAWVDDLCPGVVDQLRDRDTAFAMVSRAPLAKIEAYRARKGWVFPWFSSSGNDFNYDFHVTLDDSVAAVVYNYRSKEQILAVDPTNDLVGGSQPVEVPGLSCFLRDDCTVFHTYSTYGPRLEQALSAQSLLDLTALGARQWSDA